VQNKCPQGSEADIRVNHSISAGEHGRWHCEAEGFGRLEIDDQLVFCRRLYRQIGRFLSFQYSVYITCGALIEVFQVGPIRDKAAARNEGTKVGNRGELVAGSQRGDQLAMNRCPRARCKDYAATREPRERGQPALNLGSVLYVDRTYIHANRWRYSLDNRKLADPCRNVGVAKDGSTRNARRDLFEQLHPFSAQTVLKLHKAGNVATRSRQALDKSGAHRIGNNRKHNWNIARRPQRRHTCDPGSQNNVGCERNELGRRFTCALGSVRIPPKFDPNVPSVRPSQVFAIPAERPCFASAFLRRLAIGS